MINCAKVAKEGNIPHTSYVSSQGAKASSWIHYLKTKGEVNYKIYYRTTIMPQANSGCVRYINAPSSLLLLLLLLLSLLLIIITLNNF